MKAFEHQQVKRSENSRIERNTMPRRISILFNFNARDLFDLACLLCSHFPWAVRLHRRLPSNRDSGPLLLPKMPVALSLVQWRLRTNKLHWASSDQPGRMSSPPATQRKIWILG